MMCQKKKNCHVLDIVQSLLFSAFIAKYLYRDAIIIACHLINRLPSSILNGQTPMLLSQIICLSLCFPISLCMSLDVLCSSMSLRINGPTQCQGIQVCICELQCQSEKLQVFSSSNSMLGNLCLFFSPTNPLFQEEKHTFLEDKSCRIKIHQQNKIFVQSQIQ